MKKFLSVTLALLILFNLTSCYRPNTIFRTERSDLYAVTCFSVPYIAGNPEWDKVFIMEQDSQGRTLYKYIAIIFNNSFFSFGFQNLIIRVIIVHDLKNIMFTHNVLTPICIIQPIAFFLVKCYLKYGTCE